jgi:hypothetical protein
VQVLTQGTAGGETDLARDAVHGHIRPCSMWQPPTATLPVLLYNFPRHTQNPLNPDLVARLATRFPQLCGIKDSGRDISIIRAFKAR